MHKYFNAHSPLIFDLTIIRRRHFGKVVKRNFSHAVKKAGRKGFTTKDTRGTKGLLNAEDAGAPGKKGKGKSIKGNTKPSKTATA